MTEKTQESVSVSRVDKHTLLRQLLGQRNKKREELDLLYEELKESDVDHARTDEKENGRSKTKKWVLLH